MTSCVKAKRTEMCRCMLMYQWPVTQENCFWDAHLPALPHGADHALFHRPPGGRRPAADCKGAHALLMAGLNHESGPASAPAALPIEEPPALTCFMSSNPGSFSCHYVFMTSHAGVWPGCSRNPAQLAVYSDFLMSDGPVCSWQCLHNGF